MGSDPCAQPRFKPVANGNIDLQTASEQSGMTLFQALHNSSILQVCFFLSALSVHHPKG